MAACWGRQAREEAGLTLQEAAKKLGITPRYLAQCEGSGFSIGLMERAAAHYKCRIEMFIGPRKASSRKRGGQAKGGRGLRPSPGPEATGSTKSPALLSVGPEPHERAVTRGDL